MAVRRVLEGMLPARRAAWAERLLLLAGGGQAFLAGRCQDCVVLAHEQPAGRPPTDLPAMVAIAERSIFATRAGTW